MLFKSNALELAMPGHYSGSRTAELLEISLDGLIDKDQRKPQGSSTAYTYKTSYWK